ncbi:hypothetical protein KQX54_011170, partial [Cotesia glomerata]
LPAANDDNLFPDDNENNINEVNSLPHADIVTDNYLTEDNIMNEMIAPPSNQHTFIEIDAEPAPWIHEEYDEETMDREIWFDRILAKKFVKSYKGVKKKLNSGISVILS